MTMTPAQAFKAHPIYFIAKLLVIIGALNWLSIGIQHIDYVGRFAGANARYIFIIVGIAGVILAFHEIMWVYKSATGQTITVPVTSS